MMPVMYVFYLSCEQMPSPLSYGHCSCSVVSVSQEHNRTGKVWGNDRLYCSQRWALHRWGITAHFTPLIVVVCVCLCWASNTLSQHTVMPGEMPNMHITSYSGFKHAHHILPWIQTCISHPTLDSIMKGSPPHTHTLQQGCQTHFAPGATFGL